VPSDGNVIWIWWSAQDSGEVLTIVTVLLCLLAPTLETEVPIDSTHLHNMGLLILRSQVLLIFFVIARIWFLAREQIRLPLDIK
jgi:hypothetical protein